MKSLQARHFIPTLIITFFISFFLHSRTFLLSWKETLIKANPLCIEVFMENGEYVVFTMYYSTLRILLLLLFALQAGFLAAQTATLLPEFNRERLARTRNSMYWLGGWGAANLAVGAIGMRRTSGEQRAFHQMNLAWGAVNLGLAATGWWTAVHADPASFDLYQTVRQHHRLPKIFLFNAGLDLGYMAGGLWLRERAKTAVRRPERLRGYGRSILLQGAFLFVFDLGACLYHQGLESRLRPFLQNTSLGMTGQGVSLTVRW